MLTDTGNFDTGLPSITTALRGLVTVDVEVRALKQSVHSGMWGGPIPDPAMALAKMLAGAGRRRGRHDHHPGHLRPGAAAHRRRAAQHRSAARPTAEDFRRQAGLVPGCELLGGRHPWETNWRQPSLAVNAIQA